MNVSKKIFIYILAGLLSVCSVSASYYKSVYAIEWAGGALAFEEALKWALALMGITATAGMTDAYWDEYGDDFTDYAIENGATQTEVANWQLKLCEGILDKGSSVWTSFKSWAKSLVSGSSNETVSGSNAYDILDAFCSARGFSVTKNFTNFDCTSAIISSSDNSYFICRFFNYQPSLTLRNGGGFDTSGATSGDQYYQFNNVYNNSTLSSYNNFTGDISTGGSYIYYYNCANVVDNGCPHPYELSVGSSSAGTVVTTNSKETVKYISNLIGYNISSVTDNVSANAEIKAFYYYISNNTCYVRMFTDSSAYTVSSSGKVLANNSKPSRVLLCSFSSSDTSCTVSTSSNDANMVLGAGSLQNYLYNITPNTNLGYNQNVISNNAGDVADENFQTVQGVDQANLDVISSLVPDEDASEVTIPMPGVGTSDNTASADAYDDIVDQINSGTISLEDGLSSIQEILKVIVYDEVTDEIVPPETNPDTGENKTKEDAIKENKNNMGFSLAGLENVFPFCIPFDIYAFMSILVAEPEAPVFEIPFPNVDDLEHPLTQEVDLSAWDDAMALVRLAEDFVFIIGLMFATRSLIGAGGGD